MGIQEFSDRLYNSSVSTALRDAHWIIPTSQSIHIVSVALLIGAVAISDLRLAGILATDQSPTTVVRRHLPWMLGALIVLAFTGTLQAVAEPNRVLNNWTFWTKMGFLLMAFLLTLAFRFPLLVPESRLEQAGWAKVVKPLAWVSLFLWIAVIYCGRWIAYTIY